MGTNNLPWRAVRSRYVNEVRFDGEKAKVTWMLVLLCGHRRKGSEKQTRARCKQCRTVGE